MPRHTVARVKKSRDSRRTNRYNLFCIFVREWVARSDARGGNATTMSRVASPYWEVLTDDERAYWTMRVRELFRPTPEDIANVAERARRSAVAVSGGVSPATLVAPLIECGTPSRDQFRDWYTQLVQSGMLDVISDGLVSRTASVRGSKQSRFSRATEWRPLDHDEGVRGSGNHLDVFSGPQPAESLQSSPSSLALAMGDLPLSSPVAPWNAATYGSASITAPPHFDGGLDAPHCTVFSYMADPPVSQEPPQLAWPAPFAQDFANVHDYGQLQEQVYSPVHATSTTPVYQRDNLLGLLGMPDNIQWGASDFVEWAGGEGGDSVQMYRFSDGHADEWSDNSVL
ncbi:hypothetical protein FKP32DRAFT_1671453 [Trametes sanguinea]|nr:hypothetical protein FKP32DRAFT_1671453 [Trametes sanguinea]